MTLTAPARSALSEPVETPPASWVTGLTLLNLAIYSGWFGPIQVLLAEQASAIDPARKEAVLSLVLGVGAAVSTITNPVFGAFSDRTRLRMGRRLPWVLGGAVGGALSLLLLAGAESVTTMLFGWCGAQVFLNAMYAAAMAAIPDQVPVERRGLIGGLIAISQTLGIVGGVAIASLTGSIAAGYLATLGVLLVLTVPYALRSRDLPLPLDHPLPAFSLGPFVRSFGISPREHPDFAWAWITRFLVNLGNYVATLYLLFYLIDGLGIPEDEADERVLLLTALYAVTTVATTAVFGHWSDRIGKRKVFVIWSGIVSGAASLVLAIPQTWPAAVAAAVVLGLAFGIYTAVDFAMITQVLPAATERGKDLGVINIANALPQVLAPVCAGLILTLVASLGGTVTVEGGGWSLGYGLVYGFSFAVSLLGSVLVTRIRSVP